MTKLVPAKEPNWVRLFEEWEHSGLGQKKFCEKRGVSYTLFCRRRVEQRKRERQAARLYPTSTQAGRVGQFIPVTVEAEESEATVGQVPDSPTPEVEVELPFGVILRFRGVVRQ